MNIRNGILLVVAAVGLACGSPGYAQSEDAKLDTVFKAYLEQFFELRPLEATRLGDHRFDGQLEQLTPGARAKWAEQTREELIDLPRRIDYQKLSRAGQIDFEIFQHHLTADKWLTENTHSYEEDPRIYNGYITESVY